jgi:hypothetical protein
MLEAAALDDVVEISTGELDAGVLLLVASEARWAIVEEEAVKRLSERGAKPRRRARSIVGYAQSLLCIYYLIVAAAYDE